MMRSSNNRFSKSPLSLTIVSGTDVNTGARSAFKALSHSSIPAKARSYDETGMTRSGAFSSTVWSPKKNSEPRARISSGDTRVSPELIRALGSEFFFGLHTVDENAPLLVIPVSSYERAFAGMLEWERALNADLAPVFTSVPDTIVSESGLLEKRLFEDLIMRNYDVRVLKDNAGTIQLYYSFPTRELLIIAESPYSFAKILARL